MSFTPSWDNLDDFLGDFATMAIIYPVGKSPKTITCIFDDPYLNAQIGEYEADSSRPRITAKEADLIDMRRKDRIDVNGKTYYALEAAEGDGTGMAVLHFALEQS